MHYFMFSLNVFCSNCVYYYNYLNINNKLFISMIYVMQLIIEHLEHSVFVVAIFAFFES